MKKRTLHLIGQAHLDPAWLWLWNEGCAEILTTMQSAVDRIHETPGFCFSRSSSVTYKWAQKMDPRLFEDIKKLTKEKKWEVVGGWPVQPDCNVPSGESFVRHCLYGKSYFKRELGVDVNVGYNVDAFGHAAGLPQILANSGYKYYVFMRPQPHTCDLPKLFWWQSPDGSKVLAWHIQTGYCQGYTVTADQLETCIRDAVGKCFAPGFDDGAFFLGVGNHGGGPTRAHLKKILELQSDESLPELRFSTLTDYFKCIEKSSAFDKIPTVSNELQYHARGCYAAMGEIKMLNRRAENTLASAEATAVLAKIDHGHDYPADKLETCWDNLLFNQFHDTLSGTCVERCYQDARDEIGASCSVARAVGVESVHSIARRVDTAKAPESVLFAMNNLPWKRKVAIQFDMFVQPHGDGKIAYLRTENGKKVPIQWLNADSSMGPHLLEWKKFSTVLELPPCGYQVLHLVKGEMPDATFNSKVDFAVNEQGMGLDSFKAKDGTELLSAPVGIVAIKDTTDTWGHGVDSFRNEAGRPKLISTHLLEDGPVKRVVRQIGKWRSSKIILDVISYAGVEAVEIRVKFNFQQKHQMLKLEVPAAMKDVRSFAKVAGAVIERQPCGNEEPCQEWIAVQGDLNSKKYSLGLVNDGCYSYDCKDGLMRTTFARSAYFAQRIPINPADKLCNPVLDQGWQEKRFWLFGGKGTVSTLNLSRKARDCQTPAEYMLDSAHPGSEPWQKSFLEISANNVDVVAMKQSEDGKGFIIRLQELRGKKTPVNVKSDAMNFDFSTDINPWQIKTVKVVGSGKKTSFAEVNLLEDSVNK